jgi:hypothetical protein
MEIAETTQRMTETDIQSFVAEGFVRIQAAFSRETADAGRAILWAQTGYDSNDPATWKKAVVRLGGTQPRFMAQPPLYPAEPFYLNRANGAYSPVEQAIRQALA